VERKEKEEDAVLYIKSWGRCEGDGLFHSSFLSYKPLSCTVVPVAHTHKHTQAEEATLVPFMCSLAS